MLGQSNIPEISMPVGIVILTVQSPKMNLLFGKALQKKHFHGYTVS